ncbi:hypothetical protein QCD79_31240, partial [Pseudomonas quasicaspiana]|nr:hypothetical protein [Pseudomonas quasicaspiana]
RGMRHGYFGIRRRKVILQFGTVFVRCLPDESCVIKRSFQFELKGTLYYTGFVWETPDKYGAELENDFPAPDTKVTMAHAT